MDIRKISLDAVRFHHEDEKKDLGFLLNSIEKGMTVIIDGTEGSLKVQLPRIGKIYAEKVFLGRRDFEDGAFYVYLDGFKMETPESIAIEDNNKVPFLNEEHLDERVDYYLTFSDGLMMGVGIIDKDTNVKPISSWRTEIKKNGFCDEVYLVMGKGI